MVTHNVDVMIGTVMGDDGRPCYRDDMSLILVGDLRREVGSERAFAYYRRRFDQEHSHRFMRRHLLLDAFQSPLIEHEAAWVHMVVLAFQSLFAGRHLVDLVRRPWEPKPQDIADGAPLPPIPTSPSQGQRDIARVLAQFGTPARPSKPRGIPLGWLANAPRTRRKILPVVTRGLPRSKKQAKAA